ncbi:DUF2087 domain-containing protein [Cellulomonas iranensis]|uniref:DUF2087 domain-containing protein n=1 Tax=Cellulomonas iranensis TaxID=76862 RepID=A0ABU0GGB2_9CELL|nr:DUF2087 domain-containing protein [Cellulomonas iranensis]MDQ0424396.1 hypothetical protein [Cellulomonas iranensis]
MDTTTTPPCDAARFLVRGRWVTTPRRTRDRDELLEHVAALLVAPGEELDEAALTERIATLADDPVRVRRDLVEAGLVGRRQDGSRYWRERVTPHDDEPDARAAG